MTVFQQIIDRKIPADIVFEDECCLAFRDLSPQAPTHVLLIPKKPIPSIDQLCDEDRLLVGHLWMVVRDLARQLGLENGYRVVVNCGEEGGQTVDHLHFHLLGGRPMKWPPDRDPADGPPLRCPPCRVRRALRGSSLWLEEIAPRRKEGGQTVDHLHFHLPGGRPMKWPPDQTRADGPPLRCPPLPASHRALRGSSLSLEEIAPRRTRSRRGV